MTGIAATKEFSRKSFVKGGGALIVGFSARRRRPGRQGAGGATARTRATAVRPVPGRLVDHDQRRQHGVDQDGWHQAGNGVGDRAC